MLSTIDNPFDPFSQFDNWFSFDSQKGYNCCSYLARIAKTSTEFSDADYEREVEEAIDWIVKNDPFQIYKKVTKQDSEKQQNEA